MPHKKVIGVLIDGWYYIRDTNKNLILSDKTKENNIKNINLFLDILRNKINSHNYIDKNIDENDIENEYRKSKYKKNKNKSNMKSKRNKEKDSNNNENKMK
ncbi:hypothetical protein LY90DRAFT_510146 [Neocallimastix californiae]|uniref:Uncharacterized protein n=1 Tax=Neocallimastix californiae TaxID=1754190 RepID=A0A1Y2C447_9FUNG|nr:hypothetical protein LY90DRAFT_510146 [Neocallimastix californiae]|eukprot:ORY41810.1 hypothetical protein LY90DRAFT_510146 [Neocallimastix californiae]